MWSVLHISVALSVVSSRPTPATLGTLPHHHLASRMMSSHASPSVNGIDGKDLPSTAEKSRRAEAPLKVVQWHKQVHVHVHCDPYFVFLQATRKPSFQPVPNVRLFTTRHCTLGVILNGASKQKVHPSLCQQQILIRPSACQLLAVPNKAPAPSWRQRHPQRQDVRLQI